MSDSLQVHSQSRSALFWGPVADANRAQHTVCFALGLAFSAAVTWALNRFAGQLKGWKWLAGATLSVPCYYGLLKLTPLEQIKKKIDQCPNERLRNGLHTWLSGSHGYERRVEASERILRAYDNGSHTLSLHCLWLRSLPSGLEQLTDLKRFSLIWNHFQQLPSEINGLSQLEGLSFGNNPLETLSSDIGRFTKLNELNLYGSPLETLPDEICNLTDLVELDLSICRLSRLPDNIGNLSRLRRLDLFGNPDLNTLPKSLENLPLDREIRLGNTGIPLEAQQKLQEARAAATEGQGGPADFNDPLMGHVNPLGEAQLFL
jgi:hypothetical protein